MSEKRKTKGPFAQRFFIVLLSIIFGILLFWLLGFITKDIHQIPGPQISVIELKYVDKGLLDQQKSLKQDLESTNRDIKNNDAQQRILKESISSLQTTINQLLRIQDSSIKKGVAFSAQSQKTLTESQSKFLQDQDKYLSINSLIGTLTTQKQQLEKHISTLKIKIDEQKKLAWKEYDQFRRKYKLKVAALKLSILLPILLIAAWFMLKKRTGTFGPVIYAGFIAIFLRVAIVVNTNFPSEYHKYIAMLVIIAVVLKFLIYLLKNLAAPKRDFLIKQYQQSYDKGLCPVCSKPIHFAPLAFVRKKIKYPPAQQPQPTEYTCPACGTNLYEKCESCNELKHSLLPYCKNCSAEKKI